ncbi:replication initiation factor domain-containing protein [Rugamonas sp. DEMB1]|uniref:replication initiation factor domain-containing protein n=1 Tax=Rugamonas sp. DEMB1 TaxID=3039386 RepID=UPI0024476FF2|nr:replication initiation factor domain-containing protein [Rugamonas sp. DEMB1]WGG50328.1 replication initiation factor domain-containing protein [Rugamonas sp. DEMB1]
MRPIRHSLIKGRRKDAPNPYAEASGCSTQARSVKAQIYAVGKSSAAGAGRTASAPALPERTGAEAGEARLVPRFAQVSEAPSVPINNMGENLTGADVADEPDNWASISEEDLGEVSLMMTDSGKIKTVMVRRPSSAQACIVDWVNFTVLEDTFFKTARQALIADDQIIEEASRQFEKIFGFGITEKRDRGMNFYRESWVLGDGMGFVCFGGQRSTMLVTLSGQGCQNAVVGWEKRLFHFLTKVAMRPSISRIDLAHDDIDGDYLSVDWAYDQYALGGYTQKVGGRPPNIERIGNWTRPTGKGRTLTIGLRSSSKFCRFYEKGKKEGDKSSPWCRCEVEFKNTNTIIQFEVLLNPTDFFAAAYPCFSHFVQVETPQRMDVKVKTAQITVDACIEVTKHQFGKYIRVFRELWGDKKALDLICNEADDYWPKRMKPLTSDATSGPTPVHRQAPPADSFIHAVYYHRPVFRPQRGKRFCVGHSKQELQNEIFFDDQSYRHEVLQGNHGQRPGI